MFGFSVWEVFLVLVVALLVLGPDRLPGAARAAGEWTYKVRKFVHNAKAEMDSEFNMQDMKQILNSQETELNKLRSIVEETRHDLDQTGDQMKSAFTDAEKTARKAGTESKPAGESSTDKMQTETDQDKAPDKPAEKADQEEKPARSEDRLSALDDDFQHELSRLEEETGQNFHRPFAEEPAPSTEKETSKHEHKGRESGS